MARDLIPFWTAPSNLASLMDDEDFWPTANTPGGLSVSEDDKNVYVEAAVPGLDPKDIDTSKEPEATYTNGIMTVIFAKSPQSQPKKIAVKTGK